MEENSRKFYPLVQFTLILSSVWQTDQINFVCMSSGFAIQLNTKTDRFDHFVHRLKITVRVMALARCELITKMSFIWFIKLKLKSELHGMLEEFQLILNDSKDNSSIAPIVS